MLCCRCCRFAKCALLLPIIRLFVSFAYVFRVPGHLRQESPGYRSLSKVTAVSLRMGLSRGGAVTTRGVLRVLITSDPARHSQGAFFASSLSILMQG